MNYRNGILLINAVVPFLLCAIVAIIAVSAQSKLKDSFSKKSSAFKQSKALSQQVETSKKSISSYQEHQEKPWESLLKGQVSTQVTKTVNDIMQGIPSEDLQQTSFKIYDKKSKFTASLKYPSTSLELSFVGKYSSMQKAISEFEYRLPHFQLESLLITPPEGPEAQLTFKLNYIVWKRL